MVSCFVLSNWTTSRCRVFGAAATAARRQTDGQTDRRTYGHTDEDKHWDKTCMNTTGLNNYYYWLNTVGCWLILKTILLAQNECYGRPIGCKMVHCIMPTKIQNQTKIFNYKKLKYNRKKMNTSSLLFFNQNHTKATI